MCGLVGYLQVRGPVSENAGALELEKMSSAILSRGPDDKGTWQDCESGVGLGHRRLSIIDLSEAGHQPMVSASGRYVIAFNGEIYNYLDLRKTLDADEGAPHWRGYSDTETLLAGFDRWGIHDTITRCVGMFAFALWDRKERQLTLCRDRIGEKPLYFGWQSDTFLFGSELKALRAHSAFESGISRDAMSLLLRHSYVPTPYSIYEGISKLQPGCYLTISRNKREPEVTCYWSVQELAIDGASNPFSGSPEDAVDELEGLAKDAIRGQMISDVPLGAFLSGGVDSSAVVALMQCQSSRPVKTFSIGFHDEGFDEAVYAREVARFIGTEHTELYISPEEAMAVIPRLPEIYCEPFSDSSQIPTFLVSQLARQHVTVSLSGDGGDELFCGYERYHHSARLWGKLRNLPVFVRAAAAAGLTSISPAVLSKMGQLLPGSLRVEDLGDKLHKGSGALPSRSLEDFYLNFLVSHHQQPQALIPGSQEPPTLLTGNRPDLNGLDNMQRMMALDLMTYLPDDILVKVDRAAMGVSLETRVPFLDHRIVEFALTLPTSLKVRDHQPKWPLRQVLFRHVPRHLIERPKKGFSVPIADWLRGPLREWGEELLGEKRLREDGFFETAAIRKMWQEHVSGERRWHHQLWDVLMFQAWLECQKTR